MSALFTGPLGQLHRWLRVAMLAWAGTTAAAPFDTVNEADFNLRKVAGKPKADCEAFYSVTTSEVTVVSARHMGDHCRVSGVLPAEIRFEVNLPDQWNGRMLMTGNGGLAGQPPEDKSYQALRDHHLALGFATVYTDTGHDNRVHPGGTFAHQRLDTLIDYGYRAVHLTSLASKALIRNYYGKKIRYSYFMGCSNGGRQALMEAQRFPEDFDGILAGAPANDFTGLKFSQTQRMSALLAKPFTPEEVDVLADHIYLRCDGSDGHVDGLLSDPRTCDFDPVQHLPRCDGPDTVDCFDNEEVDALVKYYAPVNLAGKQVYPAHPKGSEGRGPGYGGRVHSGWVPWIISESGRPIMDVLGADFFRYIVFTQDDPDYAWTDFDFSTPPDHLEYTRDILDAVNPDLSRFRDRGGKLLSYFGWADPDINPLTAIAYHDQVNAETQGEANEFYRLFMVPGMFHCSGGPGPTHFDAMMPLIEWVEKGRAPKAITGYHKLDGEVVFSRPLCPWPQQAVYAEGDVKDASAWQCR
ncbi:MAG: tannase/feruloyl esterase family alpha/beta hydrolase [Pseudomonadales bacterium]|nr:tannase/feruloyl esterase family alpha/beta hydrolase [Pseudomonadales bacterium]